MSRNMYIFYRGTHIKKKNGKKMATRAASLTGFLLFFVTRHAARDVAQCHAICIFFTGGLTYERSGDARWKF